MKKIYPCIIGLGYVGLPLFVSLKKKFQVIGYDISKARIKELRRYVDRNKEFKQRDLKTENRSLFTSNRVDIKKSNFYIVTVPTPIKKNKYPDLDYIKSAFNLISNYIKQDDIIFLESTVYPGTTLEICKNIIQKKNKNINFLCKDIIKHKFKKSNCIFSYYTLQFIPQKSRQLIVNKVYDNLEWGGGFFLFEKIRGNDARFQDYFIQTYNDFKTNNGLTDIEILNKTRSLRSVLDPFSSKGNLDLLKRSGFKDISTIAQWANFKGWLAIK